MVGVTIQQITPLCGPSCQLRLSRFSVRLKFQDRPSVAKIKKLLELAHSFHIYFYYLRCARVFHNVATSGPSCAPSRPVFCPDF